MIRLGQLPVILMVGEKEWKIRTDYRDCLLYTSDAADE